MVTRSAITLTEVLEEDFNALFDENGANLRTTEVAKILGVHRVTVSRFKSTGLDNCEDFTLRRLDTLIKLTKLAIKAKDLPLEDRDIRGKSNRIIALAHILRKHDKST